LIDPMNLVDALTNWGIPARFAQPGAVRTERIDASRR